MKRLAYTVVDTVMYLVHVLAGLLVLWLFAGHVAIPAAVALTVLTLAADLAITLPLRRLSHNIQSRTVL